MRHLRATERLRRVLRSAALVLTGAVLGGCYSHVQISENQLRPESQVRALLSEEGAGEVGRQLGQDPDVLEGSVLEVDGDRILLAVSSGARRVGMGSEPLFQRVDVPRSAVVRWERRQLDRPRTFTAAAGLGVIVGWVAYEIFAGEPGGTTIVRPGDGTTEIRIPLVRIPYF